MAWLKRILALVALAVVVYLFLPLLKEIRAAAELFRTAHWIWLPVAILVQAISYAFLGWLNRLALHVFPGHISLLRLMGLLSSMAFIEVAIPSAGASGVALRARLLGKQGGYTVEVATFTLAVESIVLTVAMATVGLLGVVYMLRSGDLTTLQLVYLVAIGALVLLAVWGAWQLLLDETRTRTLVDAFASRWNRLAHRFQAPGDGSSQSPWREFWAKAFHPFVLENLHTRLSVFHSSLEQLREVPRWKFFLAAYSRVALDVATLGVCFLMFGYTPALGTLLTGYGLILVVSGLASLPGGLGLADASVPVIFARLGAPGAVALVAGLTYRLIAFWFLRFVGFLNWQWMENDRH